MKQARAFGVGVVVATQNPMDIDYRALGNAGMWCVGRLQTDADRERVVEGLAVATSASGSSARRSSAERAIDDVVKRLAPRWFVVRDVHATESSALLQPRWAMSFLRGPMTRQELVFARQKQPRLAAGTPDTLHATSSSGNFTTDTSSGRLAASSATAPLEPSDRS